MPPLSAADTFSRRTAFLVIAIGLLFSAAMGFISGHRAPVVQYLDNLVYDTFLQYSAVEKSSDDVITVDIDDISLLSVGQWPWPRYKLAVLIESLARMKPAAIGMDVIFPEPDRTALSSLQRAYKEDFGIDIGFTGIPPGLGQRRLSRQSDVRNPYGGGEILLF